jgi:hypothetical protein
MDCGTQLNNSPTDERIGTQRCLMELPMLYQKFFQKTLLNITIE